MFYCSFWCDVDVVSYLDVLYVVWIKVFQDGMMVICDEVQGDVKIVNEQLDDMILLCFDGMLVYMLVVVVDDYDMGVIYVIRGDDYFNNVVCQMMIYEVMGWELLIYVYILLIFGLDGKKLFKCYGVIGVEEY